MRSLRLVPIALLALAFTAGPALADQSQHTDHLGLSVTAAGAAAGHPELRSGHVVNTHTSGPVNFAIEGYTINGAKPDTAYAVVLLLFAGSCWARSPFPSRTVSCSPRMLMGTPTDRPRSRLTMSRRSGYTTPTGVSPGRSSRATWPRTRRIAPRFTSTRYRAALGGSLV